MRLYRRKIIFTNVNFIYFIKNLNLNLIIQLTISLNKLILSNFIINYLLDNKVN